LKRRTHSAFTADTAKTLKIELGNKHITRALVFVHGINRDADNHFRTALAAAFLHGVLDDIVIVAPRFASNSSASGNEAGHCADAVADYQSPTASTLKRALLRPQSPGIGLGTPLTGRLTPTILNGSKRQPRGVNDLHTSCTG
jgi:hypothetical protein